MLWGTSDVSASVLCAKSSKILSTPESGIRGLTNGRQLCLAVQPLSNHCKAVSIFSLSSQEAVSFCSLTCFWLFSKFTSFVQGTSILFLGRKFFSGLHHGFRNGKPNSTSQAKCLWMKKTSPALPLIRTDPPQRKFDQETENYLYDVHSEEMLSQRSPQPTALVLTWVTPSRIIS